MTLTRALYSVLIVVLFAVSGLFVITKYSDAQEQTSCPDGTELAADGVSCLSPAVNDNVVTTTSCTVGVLSNDGQTCIVPRTDAAPATTAAGDQAAPIPTFTG